MSELMAAATQIAPYVSGAAAAMGTQLLVTTQEQIAGGAVARGRAFLGRLTSGRGDDSEPTPSGPDAEATRAIAGLGPVDREALELAVGTWLEGRDLGTPALVGCIERAAIRAASGGVSAHGTGATAIGYVAGDVHAGNRNGPLQGR